MIADNEAKEMHRCASCGIAEGDDIKLMKCTACYLVKYCGVKCQKNHWPKHKKECKKRAAELRDEILFKQPESNHFGDCPICCLQLPLDKQKSILYPCCCKRICDGCNIANQKREKEGRLQRKCPFCREAVSTEEENNRRLMKRIEANDPVAMRHMGTERFHERDCTAAFEYWSRAAALGDVEAHFELSCLYHDGKGVEKDEKRELHHAEQAAIGGHPDARHNLGLKEWRRNGQYNRAVRHWIIAAKLGHDNSLENVKVAHKAGYASKEDYAAALHGYKTAVDETKSPQREEAAELYKKYYGE